MHCQADCLHQATVEPRQCKVVTHCEQDPRYVYVEKKHSVRKKTNVPWFYSDSTSVGNIFSFSQTLHAAPIKTAKE